MHQNNLSKFIAIQTGFKKVQSFWDLLSFDQHLDPFFN